MMCRNSAIRGTSDSPKRPRKGLTRGPALQQAKAVTQEQAQQTASGGEGVLYPLGCSIIMGGMGHADEAPHKGIGRHHNLHHHKGSMYKHLVTDD